MALLTIGDLTLVTSANADDLIEIQVAGSGLSRRITRANFLGFIATGGGVIATGGHTLTLGGASSINGSVVGTLNGSVVGNISGGGTLATAGFTLTLPASGTAALLAAAQTFSALNTFNSGISLGGGSTLSSYVTGTFTPVVADASSGGNTASVGTALGRYTRIGNQVTVWISLININTAGLTGGNLFHVRGLPIASLNVSAYVAVGNVIPNRFTVDTYGVTATLPENATHLTFTEIGASGSSNNAAVTVSDVFDNAADMFITITYMVG